MDYRERFGPHEEGLRLMLQGFETSLWTAMPGVIQSFNTDKPGSITAVVQLALLGLIQNSNYSYKTQTLPILYDVPVIFPSGGGCSLTFPLQSGDECLVVFAARCIDSWWQNGGTQNPTMEPRMHDLSDGFCIPGPYSQPRVIPSLSTTDVQLRSNDGQSYVGINPSTHNITVNTTGELNGTIQGNTTLTTPLLTLNGNLQVNGTVTATKEGTFNGGHTVSQHTHPQGPDSGGNAEKETGTPQG